MKEFTFGSVCSGIEAASVAFHHLNWKASWFSEIDAFPSAVIAHHYPTVPNLGDMTKLTDLITNGTVDAPDLFCGGTPCQAFSLAGTRGSLNDNRGNLTLEFVRIANAIDDVRQRDGKQPSIILWENVPGVFSTKDNAFGNFIAGLVGETVPIEPTGKRWENCGVAIGPTRSAIWRVLDAQYFGLAQRRKRVFVVASARTDIDLIEILLDTTSMQRNSKPSRQTSKANSTSVEASIGIDSQPAKCITTREGHANDLETNNLIPFAIDDAVAKCLRARTGGIDYETDEIVPFAIDGSAIGRENGRGNSSGISQLNTMYTLTATDVHGVAYPDPAPALVAQTGGSASYSNGSFKGSLVTGVQDVAPCLRAEQKQSLMTGDGRINAPLAFAPIAFKVRGQGYCTGEKGGQVKPGVGGGSGMISQENATFTLATSVDQHVFAPTNDAAEILWSVANRWDPARIHDDDVSPTLTAQMGTGGNNVPLLGVRRLTPRECERLQGFPDDYTLVEYRKKPASDAPRYKALGNSWAVPVVRWIANRIQYQLDQNVDNPVE